MEEFRGGGREAAHREVRQWFQRGKTQGGENNKGGKIRGEGRVGVPVGRGCPKTTAGPPEGPMSKIRGGRRRTRLRFGARTKGLGVKM